MIVTIDGPAGAGKSTVARSVAKQLGFDFLDTGAMYRAIAWTLVQQSVDFEDHDRVVIALSTVSLDIKGDRVLVNGRDVSKQIRDPDISQGASIVAAVPAVREVLVGWQREIAARGNYVCEGRDQGTVVFPNSRCKFFLTAAPEVRGERRWKEMKDANPQLELENVIAEQKIRDLRDETRKVGRLVRATDAQEIRVDQMTLEQVVQQIIARVQAVMAQLTANSASDSN